jgi:hypothetical protein
LHGALVDLRGLPCFAACCIAKVTTRAKPRRLNILFSENPGGEYLKPHHRPEFTLSA